MLGEELVPVCSPTLVEGPKGLKRLTHLRHATLIHVLPRSGQWRSWLATAGVTDIDPDRGPNFTTRPWPWRQRNWGWEW